MANRLRTLLAVPVFGIAGPLVCWLLLEFAHDLFLKVILAVAPGATYYFFFLVPHAAVASALAGLAFAGVAWALATRRGRRLSLLARATLAAAAMASTFSLLAVYQSPAFGNFGVGTLFLILQGALSGLVIGLLYPAALVPAPARR